jgi:YfiR/HmsC-like
MVPVEAVIVGPQKRVRLSFPTVRDFGISAAASRECAWGETAMICNLRKIRIALSLWIALTPLCMGFAQSTNPSQLEAAYIYDFAKFVEWPARQAAGSDSLLICIYGKDQVGDALERNVAGKIIRGKSIVVRSINTAEQAHACQVLYVGPEAGNHMMALLSNLREAPVLTVGDTPAFIGAGGTIGFAMESSQLHFVINVREARRAGLKISSRLLDLATEVIQ